MPAGCQWPDAAVMHCSLFSSLNHRPHDGAWHGPAGARLSARRLTSCGVVAASARVALATVSGSPRCTRHSPACLQGVGSLVRRVDFLVGFARLAESEMKASTHDVMQCRLFGWDFRLTVKGCTARTKAYGASCGGSYCRPSVSDLLHLHGHQDN